MRDPGIPALKDGFVPGAIHEIAPIQSGTLSGLTFAAKDLFDLKGQVTGAGTPDWAAAQSPAEHHAKAVHQLLSAGARCMGKTITDELAFSLEGCNEHFGTPPNTNYPDALPGGSSSGSASVVAAGLVDTALGTDTGGSVRVPAAFCGLWGMRPSHGRVATQGLLPFAPSYDTVGWFARDHATLERVGHVLLGEPPNQDGGTEILIATDALALADAPVRAAVVQVAKRLDARPVAVFPDGWDAAMTAYAALQARDIRTALGADIARIEPRFGPSIAPRFAEALSGAEDVSDMQAQRARCRDHLKQMVPEGAVLLLPTSPVARLSRTHVDGAELSRFYPRALALSSVAGHAGAPQVHIPIGDVGISVLGLPGSDHLVLKRCKEIEGELR